MSESQHAFQFPPPGGESPPAPLTVSEVTGRVRQAIRSALSGRIQVIGEISNFKVHGSGHVYFTLKDAASELSCVMWRSAAARLKIRPADGMEVVAVGELDVFERAGRYQLYVRRLQAHGVGALELAYRKLCERLQREGLFDADRKKPLPPYPRHIAILTSPTGAAIRDMLQTLQRRYPCLTVSLYPVPVQGAGAAEAVASALDTLNRHGPDMGVEIIIVARGGGSLEDLWAFNEEVLARAIARSTLPVVSGVGHEVDTTISDLVADVRAATPTAAAEQVVPVRADVLDHLQSCRQRLSRASSRLLAQADQRLQALARRDPLRQPRRLLEQRQQLVDHLDTRLNRRLHELLANRRQRLVEARAGLGAIEPRYLFARQRGHLQELRQRCDALLPIRLRTFERRLAALTTRLRTGLPSGRLAAHRQALEGVNSLLQHRAATVVQRHRARLERLAGQLQAVDYRRTLARGYSVTRIAKNGKLVQAAEQVRPGDRVRTETGHGSFDSTVEQEGSRELSDP